MKIKTNQYLLMSGLLLSMANQTTLAEQAIKVHASADNTQLVILSPHHNDKLSSPFRVKFGLTGMEVVAAGVDKEYSGHHHLLIDAKELPQAGIPMGAQVKHFGKGQTETELTLEKGTHTLQLVLGDMNHVPHQPMVVSEPITISVE